MVCAMKVQNDTAKPHLCAYESVPGSERSGAVRRGRRVQEGTDDQDLALEEQQEVAHLANRPPSFLISLGAVCLPMFLFSAVQSVSHADQTQGQKSPPHLACMDGGQDLHALGGGVRLQVHGTVLGRLPLRLLKGMLHLCTIVFV